MYDYLIVGAGLYGAVFAQEAKRAGKSVLVIDKRSHIAGNVYTEKVEGINVHKYGAHIFHTSDKKIWEYVNQFAEFNNYINSPVARYKNELYNLPFNMNTFSKMWNIATPQEAKDIIASQIADLNITEPKNLEEQALSLVGKDVYEKLIKGYTEKQWGRDCKDLPSFIIKRLPLRFIYDNNYFNDRYQGIPVGGYAQIVEKCSRAPTFCLTPITLTLSKSPKTKISPKKPCLLDKLTGFSTIASARCSTVRYALKPKYSTRKTFRATPW